MTEADEGLAQVFDGNTDFVCDSTAKASQIAAVTASTCVQAAFQLDELASMDSGKNGNISHREKDLIPYDKSIIKILKEKKKSRPFCRFEKRNNRPLSNDVVLEEKPVEEDGTSEASSDISSIASLQSIGGDCFVPMMNGLVKFF